MERTIVKVGFGIDAIDYQLPPLPNKKEIDGYSLPKEKQKFSRWKYPSDKEFDSLSEEEQLEVIRYFLRKRKEGHWFMNNGEPTYITGDHWFFLNFWRLDTGLPEYRRSNRDKCYFFDFCCKDPKCYGMINMENRRGGKTELANAILYNRISMTANAHGGIQSKTDADAKAVFLKLIRAWKRIPNWGKPIDEGDTQPKSQLRFFEAGKRSSKNKKKEYGVALDSWIDFETAKEEAYDGQKLQLYIMDECGKTTNANVYERWQIVKECFVEGKNIIGKAMLTTTVEEMDKKGGKWFKELWDKSNVHQRDENGHTGTGLYRYFKPAYDCLGGFIDEYGNPQIEEAKAYLENKRKGQDGSSLLSEKRKYPFVEEDAFGVIGAGVWDEDVKIILDEALKATREEQPPVRYVSMYENGDTVVAVPVDKNDDAIKILEDPVRDCTYAFGIDSTSTDDTTGSSEGSKIGVVVLKGYGGTGGAIHAPIMSFSERPKNLEATQHKIYLMQKYIVQKGGKLESIGETAVGATSLLVYLNNRGLEKYQVKRKKAQREFSTGDVKRVNDLYWLYPDPHTQKFQIDTANRYIRKYGAGFRMESVIKSLLNYGKQNEDEASAFLCAVVVFKDFDIVVKPKRERMPTKVARWNAAKGIYEWVEV